jgi:cell fate regulator YaaT (PSP1 superfamily)
VDNSLETAARQAATEENTPSTHQGVDPHDLVNPLPEKEATSFTTRIVGIKFRDSGRVYDYDSGEGKFNRGDQVVCDVPDKGPMLGSVSKPPYRIFPAEALRLKLPAVTRVATPADLSSRQNHEKLEADYLDLAKRAVHDRKLPMRVVDVEYPLNGKSTFIYFTSEDRVDFRELLKDLTYQIKTRVELRQLGARDETKRVGALGPCGQETCCSRFLTSFSPVSIKMAKDQGLALNPTKVSGMCGRLKCCLAYEQDAYVQAKKGLPKVGGCVKCSNGGCGTVAKLDVLKQLVTVIFDDGFTQTMPVSDIMEEQTLKPRAGLQPKTVAAQNYEEPDEEDLVPIDDGTVRFVDGKPVNKK